MTLDNMAADYLNNPRGSTEHDHEWFIASVISAHRDNPAVRDVLAAYYDGCLCTREAAVRITLNLTQE